jgi:transcriptional regulator with XRE-family HTH domain
MRGYCNNPVICTNCGSKRGFPKRKLCRSCQMERCNYHTVTPWTEGQLALLRECYSGDRDELIARRKRLRELTGYTRGAVDAQAHRMGLRLVANKPYTPEEERYIRENAGEMPVHQIATKLGRGLRNLEVKMRKMRVSYRFRHEGFNQKEFAEAMGVWPTTVRTWINAGHLRTFAGRITDTAVSEFIRNKRHLYTLRRVDEDWFKDLVFGSH